MANVIRHKRGTSNPAAGDFSQTAELLVNTNDGGVFTKTDGGSVVEVGVQSASEILTAIKTVDGSGSGLDADTVDGLNSSSFLRSDASDTATGIITFQNSNDYQIALNGNSTTWAGISFTDSGGSDYMWFNGSNGTFALGGGGSNVAGKKLHVDGGLSVGASADSTSMPSNGIYSQGDISVGGNTVLNAGNYTSYAPSLTGSGASGTWGISITGSAGSVGSTLTRGSYLTGSNFNGSAATTWAVDATTAATASKIVARDGSGNINGNYINSIYFNHSHSQATRNSDTQFYSSTDDYIRKNTASGMRTSLSVPHLAGNNTFTLAQRGQVDALTSASTITPNFNNSNNFSISLSTNTTIANPSNLTAGQSGAIAITYNGAYTVAFGSYWKFAGGTAPTATSTSGKVDVLVYYVESSTRISAQLLLNMGG